MKKIIYVLATLSIAFFCSCEGPEGIQGPVGATGASGTQGPVGPAGKITFYSTGWFKSDNNFWIKNYVPTELTSSVQISFPAFDNVTQADLNGGIVLVYDTYEENKSVINSLAYDYTFGDNHVWFSYGLNKETKGVTLNLYATFAKNVDAKKFFTETTGGNVWYRAIIIPASAGGRLKGLNLEDYNAVKTYLGLKD